MGKKRSRTTGDRKSLGGAKRHAARPGASGTSPAAGVDDAAGVGLEDLEERTPYHGTSPALTGGDVDADWKRAAASGEESVGGTVATPDQDVVDDLGKAVGVPRGPDEPFRASSEILDARDRRRGHEPE